MPNLRPWLLRSARTPGTQRFQCPHEYLTIDQETGDQETGDHETGDHETGSPTADTGNRGNTRREIVPRMPPQTQRLTISGMRKGERPMLEKLAASRQRDAGFAHTP